MNTVINSSQIKEHFSNSTDILVRPIKISSEHNLEITLFCVDGLVNSQVLDSTILKPLVTDVSIRQCEDEVELYDYLLNYGHAYHAFASEATEMEPLLTFVLSGMVAVIFDNLAKAIVFDVRTFDKRSISEPNEEGVLKGAKDSFIEVLRSNTALIRRRIRSPYLTVEQMYIGRISKTDVALVYLSDLCDSGMINDIRQKLKEIDVDNIVTASFVEEFLVNNNKTLLPQIMYTQRPDKCCSNLTDGRVVLVVDGIPFVYVMPCQLVMLFQSAEDYSENFIAGSAFRILRYVTMVVSLLLPAFYIAITSFHNQLLPVQMIISIQDAKTKVPFSSWMEVLLLLAAFEILIESGLRLPKTIGQAMSIVGGLVVGQAAVSANIISPVVVIIVALTGIAGFTIPNQDLATAVRVSRFALGILASLAGFFGLIVGIIFIVIHMCSLENYDIAYLSPFVDAKSLDVQDTILRFPVNRFKFRPEGLAQQNHRKQK